MDFDSKLKRSHDEPISMIAVGLHAFLCRTLYQRKLLRFSVETTVPVVVSRHLFICDLKLGRENVCVVRFRCIELADTVNLIHRLLFALFVAITHRLHVDCLLRQKKENWTEE